MHTEAARTTRVAAAPDADDTYATQNHSTHAYTERHTADDAQSSKFSDAATSRASSTHIFIAAYIFRFIRGVGALWARS
jgi:hypothetical protein